jgi:hypothetical protein
MDDVGNGNHRRCPASQTSMGQSPGVAQKHRNSNHNTGTQPGCRVLSTVEKQDDSGCGNAWSTAETVDSLRAIVV